MEQELFGKKRCDSNLKQLEKRLAKQLKIATSEMSALILTTVNFAHPSNYYLKKLSKNYWFQIRHGLNGIVFLLFTRLSPDYHSLFIVGNC